MQFFVGERGVTIMDGKELAKFISANIEKNGLSALGMFGHHTKDPMQQGIMKEIQKRKENVEKYAPLGDSGILLFFSIGFVNERMAKDFAAISREFIINTAECDELERYPKSLTGLVIDPIQEYQANIVYMMLSGAKKGNSYCKNLLIFLYKTYHKKEYNELKRFSNTNFLELYDLANERHDKYVASEFCDSDAISPTLARLLVFAKLLSLSDPAEPNRDRVFTIYNIIEEKAFNDFREEELRFEKCVNGIKEQTKDYLRKTFDDQDLFDELTAHGEDLSEFFRTLLCFFGLDAFAADKKGFLFVYPKEEYYVLAMQFLYEMGYDESVFDMDIFELQHYAFIAEISKYWVEILSTSIGELQGISTGETNFEAKSMKKLREFAEKVEDSGHISIKPVKKAEGGVPTSAFVREELGAEVMVLKKRLREAESEERALHESIMELKKVIKQQEEVIREQEVAREELIALRNYVYSLKNDEGSVEKAMGVEEMKAEIRNLEILIVGGHSNWISKMKNIFPKWEFVHLTDAAGVDPRIVENADTVFFFTDYISHTAYYRFLDVLRAKKIPFGYLSGVNVDRTIEQVYDFIHR